jgi:hypothetical protein
LDPATGLYYAGGGWYDAALGRYLSQAGVGNPNMYGFCGNSPTNIAVGVGPQGNPNLTIAAPVGHGFSDDANPPPYSPPGAPPPSPLTYTPPQMPTTNQPTDGPPPRMCFAGGGYVGGWMPWAPDGLGDGFPSDPWGGLQFGETGSGPQGGGTPPMPQSVSYYALPPIFLPSPPMPDLWPAGDNGGGGGGGGKTYTLQGSQTSSTDDDDDDGDDGGPRGDNGDGGGLFDVPIDNSGGGNGDNGNPLGGGNIGQQFEDAVRQFEQNAENAARELEDEIRRFPKGLMNDVLNAAKNQFTIPLPGGGYNPLFNQGKASFGPLNAGYDNGEFEADLNLMGDWGNLSAFANNGGIGLDGSQFYNDPNSFFVGIEQAGNNGYSVHLAGGFQSQLWSGANLSLGASASATGSWTGMPTGGYGINVNFTQAFGNGNGGFGVSFQAGPNGTSASIGGRVIW